MDRVKKYLPLFPFAFIGWAWCGAIMGLGPLFLPMETTLILHAILGPAGFAGLSYIYHRKFTGTGPFQSALFLIGFVIVMDAGLVAPVFQKSFAMFKSLIGTWVPFNLIFLVSWFTGHAVRK